MVGCGSDGDDAEQATTPDTDPTTTSTTTEPTDESDDDSDESAIDCIASQAAGGGSFCGDAKSASKDGPDETTTTTLPSPTISLQSGAVVYWCDMSGGHLEVFDPATQDRLASIDSECIIYNEHVSSLALSTSGRYLISKTNDPLGDESEGFQVMETDTGVVRNAWSRELSQLATQQTSDGLDAREVELEAIGFDSNRHGRLFFEDGANVVSVPVESLFNSVELVPEPVPLACHWSTNWSPGGSYCITSEWSSSGGTLMYDATQASDSDQREAVAGLPFGWYDPVWLNGDTALRGTGYGSEVSVVPAGGESTLIYERSGDRDIQPLVDRASNKLYVRSTTLDGTRDEYFLLGSPDAVAAPVSASSSAPTDSFLWFL